MEPFNDELHVPLLTATERISIAFDYVSTFITKTEKLSDQELNMLEGKIVYYLNWVDDEVIASFLRSVIKHLQHLRQDRADQDGIKLTT
jgi:hypothetical protein